MKLVVFGIYLYLVRL